MNGMSRSGCFGSTGTVINCVVCTHMKHAHKLTLLPLYLQAIESNDFAALEHAYFGIRRCCHV